MTFGLLTHVGAAAGALGTGTAGAVAIPGTGAAGRLEAGAAGAVVLGAFMAGRSFLGPSRSSRDGWGPAGAVGRGARIRVGGLWWS